MRQRLSRIRKPVNNNTLQKRRATALPISELRRESAILREHCGDDPYIRKLVDAFDAVTAEMLDAGYTVREGGPEPRRWPLHEAWKGREPPEKS